MTDRNDDILLTAYALGEVDDPAERAALERLLADDVFARQLVTDVRGTADLLSAAFRSQPDVGLTAVHVAGIEKQLAAHAQADAPRQAVRGLIRRHAGLWGSVAASTLIVSVVMAAVLPQVFREAKPAANGGAGAGKPGQPKQDDNDGEMIARLPPMIPDRGDRPHSSPAAARGGAGGGDARGDARGDWPMLKTSAGGLPWPSAVAPDTGLRGPAFVLAADFPLAVLPPTPSFPGPAAAASAIAAVKAAVDAGRLPDPRVVRTDALINSLRYDDVPRGTDPVATKVESAVCPWNSGHQLVRVTVQTSGRGGLVGDEDDVPLAGPAPLVRDLRLSVEVNPAAAAAYRVVGYENAPQSWGQWAGRDEYEVLAPGRSFTALLEVVPAGRPVPGAAQAPAASRYRRRDAMVFTSTELLTIAVEYRQGPMAKPVRVDLPVQLDAQAIELASPEFRAAAGAAALGTALRQPRPPAAPPVAATVHPLNDAASAMSGLVPFRQAHAELETPADVAVKLLSDVTATAPAEDRQVLLDMARDVQQMR